MIGQSLRDIMHNYSGSTGKTPSIDFAPQILLLSLSLSLSSECKRAGEQRRGACMHFGGSFRVAGAGLPNGISDARSCRVLGEMHAVEMPTGPHIHHTYIERENIARETSFRLGLGVGGRSAPCISLLPSDLCISAGDPPRRARTSPRCLYERPYLLRDDWSPGRVKVAEREHAVARTRSLSMAELF